MKRGTGEGSIYFEKSRGVWVGAVSLGWDEHGRRRRKRMYGSTAAEVREALLTVRSSAAAGVPIRADERLRVADWLSQWLEGIRPALRPATHASYASIVHRHVVPALGRVKLAKLAPVDVSRLLAAKLAEGLSATTVRYIRSILRIALVAAMREGLVVRNAASLATAPRPTHAEVYPLRPEEARAILETTATEPLYSLWLLALSTGMRRGELLGLQWQDIDFDAGWLTIRRTVTNGPTGAKFIGEPKTNAGRRKLALPSEAIDALRRHRVAQLEARLAAGSRWLDEGWVFASEIGTPLEPRDASRQFAEAAARAGITRRAWLHLARHSVASYLIASGAGVKAIQDQLGHVDVGTTLDIYGHLFDEARRDSADTLGRVLFGKAAGDR